jgi:hypothetical protein
MHPGGVVSIWLVVSASVCREMSSRACGKDRRAGAMRHVCPRSGRAAMAPEALPTVPNVSFLDCRIGAKSETPDRGMHAFCSPYDVNCPYPPRTHLPRLVHRYQQHPARRRSAREHAIRSGDTRDGGVPALWIQGERTRTSDPLHGDRDRSIDIARAPVG